MDDGRRRVVVFSGGGTGGHLIPALAIADALVARDPGVRPFFVGAERGIEARVLPERGIEHALYPVHGLARGSVQSLVSTGVQLGRAMVRVGELFRRLRPEMVVVTGGYAAAPAGLTARVMDIPMVLQEQNSLAGLTARLLAPFAREIHIAFPDVVSGFSGRAAGRAHLSGNPVPAPSRLDPPDARRVFGLPESGRVLLVVGGSQGSAALNHHALELVASIEEDRPDWAQDLTVFWSTGPTHLEGIEEALAELGSPGWVKTTGFIDRMPDALAASDLALSRSGAMTTSGFLSAGLPAVLVPLPTSAADHQVHNAWSLERAGAATVLIEAELTPTGLTETLREVFSDPARLPAMRAAALELGVPDAADRIAGHLVAILDPEERTSPDAVADSPPGGSR